jgi:hypothetical protein
MSKYVALHDRRLEGGIPARPSLGIIHVDAATSLTKAFLAINNHARVSKVHSLFILCHGYSGSNNRARISMDAGGMGLQLGKEGLHHSTVTLWRAIAARVRNIVIFACAAADTQPGNAGTTSDGRYLMGALALHTGADVYAADLIQWYATYKAMTRGRFDFGAWEGQLWRFFPTGQLPEKVLRAPVEIGDVFTGSAP